jgi:hypothetical protein
MKVTLNSFITKGSMHQKMIERKKNSKKTAYNNAYSLWRVNSCQQGFRSVVSFDFGGQERASKPPQAICKPLASPLPPETKILVFAKNYSPHLPDLCPIINDKHLLR